MIPFPKAPRSQEYIRKEGKKKEEKRKSNVERGKEVEGLTRFVISSSLSLKVGRACLGLSI